MVKQLHTFHIQQAGDFPIIGRKEGNDLFNDALITFYFRLYGVIHMVKYYSDSERVNPLPPLHGLLFLISGKGSFIYTPPQTG